MATGRIDDFSFAGLAEYFMLSAFIFLVTFPAYGRDVGLTGVLSGRALLTIDGATPQVLAVGQSLSGVRLISIQDDQAIVEVDGKKRALRIGQHAGGSLDGSSSSAGSTGDQVTLTAAVDGHFFATGAINGVAVRFLVDTGASDIALGVDDARRIGLDLSKGQRAVYGTANGRIVATRMKVDSVRVGDVTLYNVDASVLQHDMPYALLGMSFLNRMEMQRAGSIMTLKKRF